jgi:hypothetical protein
MAGGAEDQVAWHGERSFIVILSHWLAKEYYGRILFMSYPPLNESENVPHRTIHGKVEGGRIIASSPVKLSDLNDALITVWNVPDAAIRARLESLLADPAIGMWADREDMVDSSAWIREQRAKWLQRPYRSD